jgi:hypothetical protein
MTDDDAKEDVIYQSLISAQDAVTEWETARKFRAQGSSRHNVEAQKLRAEHAIFLAAERLRPHLLDKLPDYWRGYDDKPKWLYYDEEIDAGLPGLKHLLQYRGRVSTSEETHKAHDGYHTEQVEQAEMLPPEAIRSGLSWVSQACFMLGFTPDPGGKRRVFNISRDGDGDESDEPEEPEKPAIEDPHPTGGQTADD